ncbi:hypothetical protein L6452_38541 [Arctium lappa]|uniref:Uncharacterized protein n=1 Tax=Arctium lappa TaxID=4217 RepID=A0ACB8XTY1_ARCLA|nr:hypothetical protein L6452_38541 [Arctium lappa]
MPDFRSLGNVKNLLARWQRRGAIDLLLRIDQTERLKREKVFKGEKSNNLDSGKILVALSFRYRIDVVRCIKMDNLSYRIWVTEEEKGPPLFWDDCQVSSEEGEDDSFVPSE